MKMPRRLKRMLSAPRRLALRKGFGVHSPFAFRFVRNVLAQPNPYYCYGKLNRIAKHSGMNPRLVKLAFRLALFARPSTAYVPRALPVFATAIAEGSPHSEIISDSSTTPPQLAIVENANDLPAAAACVQAQGIVMVVKADHHPDLLQDIWQQTSAGMLFHATSVAVIVARTHLPRQAFNIWL